MENDAPVTGNSTTRNTGLYPTGYCSGVCAYYQNNFANNYTRKLVWSEGSRILGNAAICTGPRAVHATGGPFGRARMCASLYCRRHARALCSARFHSYLV